MRLKLRRISTGFLLVTGGSGHQAVKFRVPGELVGEGDDGAAHPDQAVTGLGAGDVGHLVCGDVQQLGKLRPVGGRLVQQHQKLTVGEHEPGGVGAQTFLYVLRGGGHGGGILAKPLPALIEELRRIVVAEEQIHLIHE